MISLIIDKKKIHPWLILGMQEMSQKLDTLRLTPQQRFNFIKKFEDFILPWRLEVTIMKMKQKINFLSTLLILFKDIYTHKMEVQIMNLKEAAQGLIYQINKK